MKICEKRQLGLFRGEGKSKKQRQLHDEPSLMVDHGLSGTRFENDDSHLAKVDS